MQQNDACLSTVKEDLLAMDKARTFLN